MGTHPAACRYVGCGSRSIHKPGLVVLHTFLLVLACGAEITDVIVPASTSPNSIFYSVIEAAITDSGSAYGGAAILLPNGWYADDVSFESELVSGKMDPCSTYSEALEWVFGSASYERWCGFSTGDSLGFEIGEVYFITMEVHTDDLLGTVELGFHVDYSDDGEYWVGEYSPAPVFGYFIEVIETALSRETWGMIKTSFD
jgi:hypothetical protein